MKMLKEPKSWWMKQIVSALIIIFLSILIPAVVGYFKEGNWYLWFTKWYSGWIAFVILFIIWLVQEYEKKYKVQELTSSGGKSIFGNFEEHEGKSEK